MKNYYRILGLTIDAEHEEIKAAYRILAQRYHPDKGGSHAEFILIQEAYDILSNPLTKRTYDRDLLRSLAEPASQFAKPNSNIKTHIKPHRSQHNLWLLLLGGFAVGGIIFAGWAYQQYQQDQAAEVRTASALFAVNQRAAPAPTHYSQTPLAQTTNHRRAGNQTSNPAQNNKPLDNLAGTYYLLNVGSFTSHAAATAQQAILRQQGIISSIQPITANSEGLASYNLFVGPYRQLSNAYQALDNLESHNIEASLQRVDAD